MDRDLAQALNRLDQKAIRCVQRAAELSEQREDGYLGVEHLAFALLEDPEVVARIRGAGLDPELARQIATDALRPRFRVRDPGGLPCTPRLFTILAKTAPRIAERHGAVLVSSVHILAALLGDEETPLVQALVDRGVDLQRIRRLVEPPPSPPLNIPSPLSRWCDDLTARAERDELPPLVGRVPELDALIRILLTPAGLDCSNPLLTGEPGVGKTAVVYGLTQRIAMGLVPDPLKNVRIVELDMNAMLAGTMFRGTFEDRLKETINFALTPQAGARVVLFIDEIHHIIGAGRADGINTDAAEILLRPLGRGDLRIIGATTTDQYLTHFKEGPIGRRFMKVEVTEPNATMTKEILRGVRVYLEQRFRDHGMEVRITDEAIDEAVDLASRYLLSERCPAKPRRWLIEAAKHSALEGRCDVSPKDVVTVVAAHTGIPEDVIFRRPRWTPAAWETALKQEIRGQDECVHRVTYSILHALGPLRSDQTKPLAVFLFAGPTGVGKTELAKALCRLMFKDEKRLLRFDMSEYVGPGAVQRLIGPPRGIQGAGRGELTDRVRGQPYAIILLDEFEKADPEVRRLFLQVFDEGWLADGVGNKVYFQDAIIILTSNLGADQYEGVLHRYSRDVVGFPTGANDPDAEDRFFSEVRKAFDEAVRANLSPELANRITALCIFSPLTKGTLIEIAQLWFEQLAERFAHLGKTLIWDREVVECLVARSFDRRKGAREIRRAFDWFVAEQLSPRLYEGSQFRVTLTRGGRAEHAQLVVEVDAGMQPAVTGE